MPATPRPIAVTAPEVPPRAKPTGFPAGIWDAHHLANRGTAGCLYLEVGDRTKFERMIYPDDDLDIRPGPDGRSVYCRKDGTPVF